MLSPEGKALPTRGAASPLLRLKSNSSSCTIGHYYMCKRKGYTCRRTTDTVLTERVGQFAQQPRSVATPRAAMHARERARILQRELFQHRAGVGRMRVVVHGRAERFAGPEDVAFGQRHFPGASLREQVATEKRAG